LELELELEFELEFELWLELLLVLWLELLFELWLELLFELWLELLLLLRLELLLLLRFELVLLLCFEPPLARAEAWRFRRLIVRRFSTARTCHHSIVFPWIIGSTGAELAFVREIGATATPPSSGRDDRGSSAAPTVSPKTPSAPAYTARIFLLRIAIAPAFVVSGALPKGGPRSARFAPPVSMTRSGFLAPMSRR
jgi:hypothetical protein